MEKSNQQGEPTWEDYYNWLEGREPRPVFMEALALFSDHPDYRDGLHAVDLGCGDGTETVALLEAGWQVLAIDNERAAIRYLQSKVSAQTRHLLEARVASFEDIELPETDFIFAGYSLPFCKPEYFDRLWRNIADQIRPGGRFAGQLFGFRDSWADEPEMTFHSKEQVQELLNHGFEVETLVETEEDGEAFSGPKHWHIFDIIAQKVDR